jgi:hypothetical protein
MIDYQLVLDLLITLLLGITIGYAVILNRRLSGFRKQKAEMEAFIHSLDDAVERAEASIHRLRGLAETSGGDLQTGVDKASSLVDELTFMTDRGNAIADRLEKAASGAGRALKQQQAAAPAPEPQAAPARSQPQSQPQPQPRQVGIETRAEEEAAARLAASRIVEAAENAAAAAPAPRAPQPSPAPERPSLGDDAARSEAERELLKALRSVR